MIYYALNTVDLSGSVLVITALIQHWSFHVVCAKLCKVKKHKLINGCMALQDRIALESWFRDVLKNLTLHIHVVHLAINMPSKYIILQDNKPIFFNRWGGGVQKTHVE